MEGQRRILPGSARAPPSLPLHRRGYGILNPLKKKAVNLTAPDQPPQTQKSRHSHIFREMAKQMGLTQSYSRTANCYDNATMECFNGTFKVEALYNPLLQLERPSFKEQNDFIGRYIEFYNKQRPCSVIGNLTPEQYRQAYYEKTIQGING